MGSDIFTSKCEAHNYVVPYRSSCPVCVSAKRSQLHAANLAHMPRYLFEQQLDVRVDSTSMASGLCVLGVDAPKPVRSYMKAPEQAKPCDVRWKVNFKVDEPAIKPVTVPKYKLTLRSRDWKSHYDIMEDTQEVFRILEFGIPEVYQRWFSLCESVHKGTITVESMAYTMWDTVVQQHELRELKRNMLVRNDFVARFKYLYVIGTQRIVIDETAQLPAVDDDLVGCLYNYLGTSSKTLYHEQSLLENWLDQEKSVLTRDGVIGRFRRLTALVTDAYAKDRMYDWEKINAKTQRALQERLADAYLEGKRR